MAESLNSEAPEFVIHVQYLKDLSFENPKPLFFLTSKEEFKPAINVNVQVNARHLAEDTFEVVLEINADAKKETDPMFVCQVQYAALIGIRKDLLSDETQVRQILLEKCPQFIFPFVRNVISDLTKDSGFPPLVLQPVDFATLNKKQNDNHNESDEVSAKRVVN